MSGKILILPLIEILSTYFEKKQVFTYSLSHPPTLPRSPSSTIPPGHLGSPFDSSWGSGLVTRVTARCLTSRMDGVTSQPTQVKVTPVMFRPLSHYRQQACRTKTKTCMSGTKLAIA